MMLKYELKKVFRKKINCIILILIIVGAFVFSAFALNSFVYEESSRKVRSDIFVARDLINEKNKWSGQLTTDKIKDILKSFKKGDFQSTYDIIFMTSSLYKGEFKEGRSGEEIMEATPKELKSLYEIYENNLDKESLEYGKSPNKINFLRKQYMKIKTPFKYEAASSWDKMFLYATTYSLVLLLAISFLVSSIFTDEFKNRAYSIFFSTKYGKSKAIRNKIIAGLIISTSVYVIGISLLSIISFSIMGTSGASAMYQLERPYAIYIVTFREMYFMILLGGLVASLLTSTISMYTASKIKSTSVAVCAPFILFMLSPFIGRALPFKTFFTLTPDQLTNIMNCDRIPYIYEVGNFVFRQIPFILIFYSIISILIIPFIYINFKKSIYK